LLVVTFAVRPVVCELTVPVCVFGCPFFAGTPMYVHVFPPSELATLPVSFVVLL